MLFHGNSRLCHKPSTTNSTSLCFSFAVFFILALHFLGWGTWWNYCLCWQTLWPQCPRCPAPTTQWEKQRFPFSRVWRRPKKKNEKERQQLITQYLSVLVSFTTTTTTTASADVLFDVVDDVAKRRPAVRVMTPAILYERSPRLWHILANLWAIPTQHLSAHIVVQLTLPWHLAQMKQLLLMNEKEKEKEKEMVRIRLGMIVNSCKKRELTCALEAATHPHNDAKTIHVTAVGVIPLMLCFAFFCSLFENLWRSPPAGSHSHALHLRLIWNATEENLCKESKWSLKWKVVVVIVHLRTRTHNTRYLP